MPSFLEADQEEGEALRPRSSARKWSLSRRCSTDMLSSSHCLFPHEEESGNEPILIPLRSPLFSPFLFNSRIFKEFNTSSSLPNSKRNPVVVRNSAGMQCSTRRLFTDTEMCTHAVVSQRGEINKDKREQRGESTGRDNNVQLYLV